MSSIERSLEWLGASPPCRLGRVSFFFFPPDTLLLSALIPGDRCPKLAPRCPRVSLRAQCQVCFLCQSGSFGRNRMYRLGHKSTSKCLVSAAASPRFAHTTLTTDTSLKQLPFHIQSLTGTRRFLTGEIFRRLTSIERASGVASSVALAALDMSRSARESAAQVSSCCR